MSHPHAPQEVRLKDGPEACTEVCQVDLREKRDGGQRRAIGKDEKVRVSTAHLGDGEKISETGVTAEEQNRGPSSSPEGAPGGGRQCGLLGWGRWGSQL